MGCPKGGNAPGQGDNLNPNMEFQQGIKSLQKIDRKSGQVDYDTAFQYFQSAVNLKPDFANAAYNAAWTSEQLGNTAQALDYYQKAYDASPTKDFLFALVDVQKKSGSFEDALATLGQYVTKNPSDLEVQYAVVETHTEMGNADAAKEVASEILLNDSTDITVYQLLSRAFYKSGQFDMSLLCAAKANEMLVSVAKEKGQPEKKDAGILNNMGVTFLAMEDESEAIRLFQEAITLEPNHVEANLNLGFISLNSGNYPFALEKFEAALVTNPSHTSARIGKAVSLRGVQDFDTARQLYTELLTGSSDKLTYFNAAILEAKYQKDYAKAKVLLNKYKSIDPADTEVDERLAALSTLQAEEEARRKAEEEKRKAEEERKKRQLEKMNELKTAVASLQVSRDALANCTEALESGVFDMADMVLEQGQMVIEEEDIEMAGDVIPFVADTQSSLDSLKESCAGAPAAPAPTEEAPTEPTEDSP
jgi:tetratricopeptide (TPR) repeat protein